MADYFSKAVDSVSHLTYMSSKSEIIDYYKDTYGAKAWTGKIARDLYGTIKNKKGENMSIPNIQRRFQGGRELKDAKQKETKQQFAALGKQLPSTGRKPDKNTITVTVKGKQKGNKGRPERDRTINVTLSGEQAIDFVNDPSWDAIWDAYGFDFGIDDEMGDIDPDYTLTGVSVSAA